MLLLLLCDALTLRFAECHSGAPPTVESLSSTERLQQAV